MNRIILRDYGYFRSVVELSPLDASGSPTPWFTFPAIEFLKQFDLSTKSVFEYGAGASTLFWAKRTKRVVSVESNPEWFNKINDKTINNLKLFLRPDRDSYINEITAQNPPFDIIVIDGKWRNACMDIAPSHLANGGQIIVDNSDRNYSGCAVLRSRGFLQIDFSGFTPINKHTSTTSFFVRGSTSFQETFQVATPVGGLREQAGPDD